MTLKNILESIGVLLDGEAKAPVPSSDDWSSRVNVINGAQADWAESLDWQVLYKQFHSRASLVSTVTVPMPADFRKLSGYPKVGTDEYTEIRAQEREQYTDSDKICYIRGNYGDGYNLIFSPGAASSASIMIPYIATPTSLETLTAVSPIPDPNYLVWAGYSKLLRAEDKADWLQAEAQANRILDRMIASEQTPSEGSTAAKVRNEGESKYSFRWGRD